MSSLNLQRMLAKGNWAAQGDSTSSNGMDTQALLMPNTAAFNSQLQQDICKALSISTFYCQSRIQVVSTTNTTPVLANVDFYPSTNADIATAGPQSAQDLLTRFQGLPKAALSGLLATATVAGGAVTQKCPDGSFQTVCPTAAAPASSSSSSTAWYIPVIVVVVVVVVIGLLVAAYFIKRRPKPVKLETPTSASNTYEPPHPHLTPASSVPVVAAVPVAAVPVTSPAAAAAVYDDDANLPVSNVDYPAPTPGLKFMYTTPEWDVQSPSADADQVKATPRDVHVRLDDDHPDADHV